jgi:hypothetical protein
MRTTKRRNNTRGVHAFAGACLLTGALLLPHARLTPVLIGMGLAGLIQWTWKSYRNSSSTEQEDGAE